MSQRQPQRLPMSSLDEMIDSDFTIQGIRPFLTPNLGVLYGVSSIVEVNRIIQQNTPYRIDDFRFVIFNKADIHVTANLLKYHITDNTVGFMGNGGIIQMEQFSPFVKMSGILVKEDYLRIAMGGRLPKAFDSGVRHFYIPVDTHESMMVDRMIGTLRALVNEPGYNQETAMSLVAAIVNYYAGLFERHHGGAPRTQSHRQSVFSRFIALVNEHCARHHTLDFYADRLCITPRYLGTLVKQVSDTTAKEWIDRAIINEAKVALKHSDITVAQLADRLNFPNASFFCKFFKRMTGLTPVQYQRG